MKEELVRKMFLTSDQRTLKVQVTQLTIATGTLGHCFMNKYIYVVFIQDITDTKSLKLLSKFTSFMALGCSGKVQAGGH